MTGNDVIQYWEDDEATRVCMLSLDSIGNPRKFSRIARRLTRRKPIIVFAPGRTSRASHLGDRGGLGHAPEAAVDALFRQAGVMVVHQRGAMFDIAKIASRQPLPAGPRVGLITNSAPLAHQMRASFAPSACRGGRSQYCLRQMPAVGLPALCSVGPGRGQL